MIPKSTLYNVLKNTKNPINITYAYGNEHAYFHPLYDKFDINENVLSIKFGEIPGEIRILSILIDIGTIISLSESQI